MTTQTTLAEAKEMLREKWIEGVSCPCCNQYVMLYPRKITSTMAWVLVKMYQYFEAHDDEYMHVGNYMNSIGAPSQMQNSGDPAKMKFWGLIEQMPTLRDDGSKRNGYWKITQKGRQFVRMNISVPRVKYVYNDKVYDQSSDMVTIQDCLERRNRFNYSELMSGG